MQTVGIPYADSILNFIVIVAALSAMNSMLYIATRMMFSLSRAGDAPAVFGRVAHNGVPLNALSLCTSGIAVAAIVYTVRPETAFPVMIALSMFGAMFTWTMVFFTHFFFRRKIRQSGVKLKLKMPGYPIGTFLGFVLILAVLLTTWFTELFHSTLVFGVPFLLFLVVMYFVRHRKTR